MILKLSSEINEKKYLDLIIFLQRNKYDVNNSLIDKIINEDDNEKKSILIDQMNKDNSIDFNSSGYVAQLFSLFKNNEQFCLIETKNTECILCGKKISEKVKDSSPFIFIKKDYINENHIYNILLNKYKEIYSYDCECRKGSKEDVLCTKIKYNIESYLKILFILFDMNYEELNDNKNPILKLIEDTIILNFNVEYKLSGIIACPSFNHYNAIIFNPLGCNIDKAFSVNFIYYHDGTSNNGNITR